MPHACEKPDFESLFEENCVLNVYALKTQGVLNPAMLLTECDELWLSQS